MISLIKKIRLVSLSVIARFLALAIKIRGKSSGTSFIGMMLLKIDPNFLKYATQYVDNYITITGTNGKTTTSGILTHILEKQFTTLSNSKGANMLTGIANAFALSSIPFKSYEYAVLESDEAYLSRIYDYVKSDYLIVTNLFRDQLDRYGELATTAKKIQSAIDKNPNLKLILNADDPLVVGFKAGNDDTVYYGFEEINYANKNIQSKAPMEAIVCPTCGGNLNYEKTFYAQQGHYYCDCGYKRPKTKYPAKVTIYDTYSEIEIADNVYKIPLVGLYNAYNALAGIVMCLEKGIIDIQPALDSFKSAFGRSEVKTINGKRAIIQLIKNPTGASEVLKTIDLDSNILIAINDKYADGRDVSWLWDTDFEILKDSQKTIVTSGVRAEDMAVRLKYAGVKNIKVIKDIDKAMKYVTTNNESDKVTILPTYTALLHINKGGKG